MLYLCSDLRQGATKLKKTEQELYKLNYIVILLYTLQELSLERHPISAFCCTVHVMQVRAGASHKRDVALPFQTIGSKKQKLKTSLGTYSHSRALQMTG